ncbi:RsmE family RNA methyltransferase [Flavitalea antarctica]
MTSKRTEPFFFVETLGDKGATQMLSEEASKHIVQVLRMKTGELLRLTDGLGKLAEAVIINDHKKKTEVTISAVYLAPRPESANVIAISLLKNNTRFEWFLEKASELGISKIVPLICARTEKQHFRYDRMKSILVSAMLQSQQPWLTELSVPITFKDFLSRDLLSDSLGFIAHCEDTTREPLHASGHRNAKPKLVLIGPEGDFTPEEISLATGKGFLPVELGGTRLRTETAGVVAATIIQLNL